MGLRQWLAEHVIKLRPLPSPEEEWPGAWSERAERERQRNLLRIQIREVNEQLDQLRRPNRG